MKYLIVSLLLSGCINLQSKQISTEEKAWIEDPKTSELLYCQVHVSFTDMPVCWEPKRIKEK